MGKMIIEVRILVDIPDEEEDQIGATHDWLKANITGHIDWEQGDVYPEGDAPLQ